MNIIKTKLNDKGDLVLDKVVSTKTFSILTLTLNPFQWHDFIKKDTNNFDEKFVQKFLKDVGISFSKLRAAYDWVPYYYVTFLMELSNSIKELGIGSFKENLRNYVFPKQLNFKFDDKMLDLIPETINEKTKIAALSDIFNPFTNVDFMIFTFS